MFNFVTDSSLISSEPGEQYIQAHADLMTKAERWPAEPTPPLRRRRRRRHVPGLTHCGARNHRVMNPSVFGRFRGTYES